MKHGHKMKKAYKILLLGGHGVGKSTLIKMMYREEKPTKGQIIIGGINVAKLRNGIWRNMGGCLAPMNAFLNVVGMETMGLRMERICQNAFALSKAINELDGVSANYPLLSGNRR